MCSKREVGGGRASEAIIDAVAEERGCDATELLPPMAESVDPEAIDAILESVEYATIEFEWAECRITAATRNGDGIEIEAAPVVEQAGD